MTAAVFKATYADWKLVKTRGVVQVVFEVPLANEQEAYKVVGGMPDPARERWFAVARLNPEAKEETTENSFAETRPRPSLPPQAGGANKKWDELSPAQQAGILSNEQAFRTFLAERFGFVAHNEHDAAEFVHRHCAVGSRRDLGGNTAALEQWRKLVANYRTWQRAPEHVG